MLARNNTGSIFVEDVGEFLTANNIRATASIAFYGNSGMTLLHVQHIWKNTIINVESRYKPVKKLVSII